VEPRLNPWVEKTTEALLFARTDGAQPRTAGLDPGRDERQRLALVVDGKVLSAPDVLEPITGGQTQIAGKFTCAEADAIVATLRGR
jgi:preprotein translocase subunit SecD